MRRATLAALLVLAPGCADEAPGSGGGSSGGEAPEDDGILEGSGGADESGDEGPLPPASDTPCDVFEQDCPPTQKCMPFSGDGDSTWNDLRCSSLASAPKQLGEPCVAPSGPVAGEDDCDVGLMCWNVEPDGTQGECIALCAGSIGAGQCPVDTICSIYNGGMLPICLPTCDPLGGGCGPGELCIPQGNGGQFVCAVDASNGSGSYGDPCLAFNKCNGGLFCAPAPAVPGCTEAAGCCSSYCDLSDDDPDAACDGVSEGQMCVPFTESGAAPGTESVGGCSAA
ncbi:MAG: hypothetical protein ACE37F_01005 [Nannocystaceae bacterium]|nr:hypothetical protein [bacterium]